MNVDSFAEERTGSWSELERLLLEAHRKPERLGPAGVLRFGALYRSAAADLAIARTRYPRDPLVSRLEQLVGRARSLVYDAPTRRSSAWRYLATGYWRSILARPAPLLIAIVLLAGSTLLAGAWAIRDPGAAAGLVPAQYRSVTEPRPHGSNTGLSESERSAVSSQIFTNNIQVTLLAFAAGLLAGLGTAVLLIYNGVLLGVVGGLTIGSGNGRVFLELVLPHGVLELTCIVVASAAGIRVGWALVEPGRRSRGRALVEEARTSLAIVLGTAPWLVVAGLTEAFVTGSGNGLAESLAVGLGLGGLYWSLLLIRGRPARTATE